MLDILNSKFDNANHNINISNGDYHYFVSVSINYVANK